MINYEVVFVKLINNQSEKLESAAKNKTGTLRIKETQVCRKSKTGTTLRVALKVEKLLHELYPTTRQKTKINAFANNMSTDIRLSKAQSSKIIQLG